MFSTRAVLISVGGAILCVLTSSTTSASPAPMAAAYEEPMRRLNKAFGFCTRENSFPATNTTINTDPSTSIAGAFVRCMATNMDLWSDADGYNAKRVAKFFIKQRNENEIMTVVDYCNQRHQQANLDLWAFEAFRCGTAGRMGTWLAEYMIGAKI